MGKGKGGSPQQPTGQTTTTQNTAPWAPIQPYLQDVFGQASSLYHTYTPQYYPNNTVQPPTDAQLQGLANVAGTAGALQDQLYTPGSFANNPIALTNQLLQGQFTAQDPGLAQLQQLMGQGNAGLQSPGNNTLQSYAFGQQVNPGQAVYGTPGGNALSYYAQGQGLNPNAIYGSPGGNALAYYSQGQGINPNAVYGTPGGNALSYYAQGQGLNPNAVFGTQGGNALDYYARGQGINPNAVYGTPGGNALAYYAGGQGLNAGSAVNNGPGGNTLNYFASGQATNPLLSSVAQSTMAGVLPGIQSQFINGGGLSSPQAAYASSQGASAALAPVLSNALMQEQQNQLNAGGQLQSNYLNTLLGQSGQQIQAGQNLTSDYLNNLTQQQGLQIGAGQNLTSDYLSNLAQQQGLQVSAGQNLTSDYLSNLLGQQGLQAQTGQNLTSDYLSNLQNQQQNQIGAGTALNQQYLNTLLGQQGQQLNAGGQLAANYLSGAGLQTQQAGAAGTQYGSDIQRMLQGLSLVPQTTQNMLGYGGAQYAAGNAQQQIFQQQLNDSVNRFNYQQDLPYQQLNQFLGELSGNYGSASSLSQPYYINQGANLLSGGLGGAALGNALFPATAADAAAGTAAGTPFGKLIGSGLGALASLSDRRLKVGIKEVGRLDNGLKVYSYRIAGQARTYIGLMADEVAKVHPDAVISGPFGYDMVDYEKAVR